MPLPMYQDKPKHPLAGIRYILAIAAGKGGVGKSTLTVNLALALQHLGYRVGVLDADVYGPSVRKMLPEDRLPSQKGETLIPALCHGIQMISMAYFRGDDKAAAVRAPIANGIISQFIENVAWGELDYLLIDFPPGTGDIQLTLAQKAHISAALMLTTPQEVALMDVRKAMHLFEQVKIPILGVIENMSYYIHESKGEKVPLFGKGGGEKLARETGAPFLGAIPIAQKISEASDEGRSLFSGDSQQFGDIQNVFLHLAGQIKDHLAQSQEGLQSFELMWEEIKG